LKLPLADQFRQRIAFRLGENLTGKIVADNYRARKEAIPALDDRQITSPCCTLGIDMEYDVTVIVQCGIGADIDRK
jgi:hypothetical protein